MRKIMLSLLWACLLHSGMALGQTRRALVIGLGKQQDRSWAKINGDKDVPFVQEMLGDAGFREIRTLTNEKATKAGIVAAFRSLASRCSPGDMVYVHFSGHGQQVTDVNGDEWPDTLDEAWIPYDACLSYGKDDRGEKHLVDDEINVLLAAIRDRIGDRGRIWVVVDACHSGGSTRGSLDDGDEVTRGVWKEFVIPGRKGKRTRKAPERWLTLSACEKHQYNQEIKEKQVGKLTYALYILAKKGKFDFKDIEAFMDRYRTRWPQNPVLTGEKNRYGISDFIK